MTQADRVHSTPPTNTSSRRKFLAQAAAAVAGGAAIRAALTLGEANASERVQDPILAAIEAHRTARAALVAAVDWHSALERELPKDKRRSFVTVWDQTIVETDDPRWIDCEFTVIRCHSAETEAACTLISILPTTMAGVAALLRYTVDADTDGEGWPRGLQSDDGKSRDWQHFLIANLAEIIPALSNECA